MIRVNNPGKLALDLLMVLACLGMLAGMIVTNSPKIPAPPVAKPMDPTTIRLRNAGSDDLKVLEIMSLSKEDFERLKMVYLRGYYDGGAEVAWEILTRREQNGGN